MSEKSSNCGRPSSRNSVAASRAWRRASSTLPRSPTLLARSHPNQACASLHPNGRAWPAETEQERGPLHGHLVAPHRVRDLRFRLLGDVEGFVRITQVKGGVVDPGDGNQTAAGIVDGRFGEPGQLPLCFSTPAPE